MSTNEWLTIIQALFLVFIGLVVGITTIYVTIYFGLAAIYFIVALPFILGRALARHIVNVAFYLWFFICDIVRDIFCLILGKPRQQQYSEEEGTQNNLYDPYNILQVSPDARPEEITRRN